MNKISAKDVSILVSILKEPWDPRSSQKPQFLRSCYKCFSGGTFQIRYYFWTLLAVTKLSIRHTYKLLLFCHGKASNVQGKPKKRKIKQQQKTSAKNSNNNKQQTTETNQNKTKIYKRANEEYITHAQ